LDKYGDHFTQSVDAKRLRDVLDEIDDELADGDIQMLDSDFIKHFKF